MLRGKRWVMGYLFVLLAVAMAVSALGWIYFIYFFSIGYGFGIAALAVTIATMFYGELTLPTALICMVLFVFGCRLGAYLLTREKKSASYRKILYGPDASRKKNFGVVIVVWVFCALLYVGQVSPVVFYLANASAGEDVSHAAAWVGMALMIAGVLLEATADMQKAEAKAKRPDRFVDRGLYKIVRCPNYLGELVIWTGSFVLCFGAHCTLWQWLIAAMGYAGIIYVMFSGARRLELRQNQVYGENPDYIAYVKKTPLLIPLVPLYSLAKCEWLKA